MRYSAALLVKQSANQLNWHYRRAIKQGHSFVADAFKKELTPGQIEGEAFAKEQKLENSFVEMRGQLDYKDDTIYFSFDLTQFDSMRVIFTEVKKPPDKETAWYFQQSLIQVAFYDALWHYSDHKLKPASFSPETVSFDLSTPTPFFHLNFGGKLYNVESKNPKEVMQFFLTKKRASTDYTKAKRFDATYKHQEWEKYFKDKIAYLPI